RVTASVPLPPHDDLAKAATLPSSVYGADAYPAHVERVLASGWHFLGHERLVSAALGPTTGMASPLTLLPGSLDEPLLLARDASGPLRCLSNVCTHRGNVLLDRPFAGTTLRCGYHGRCFSLEGRCVAAPGFEDAERFPSAGDDLPVVALGRLGPLLFA